MRKEVTERTISNCIMQVRLPSLSVSLSLSLIASWRRLFLVESQHEPSRVLILSVPKGLIVI